MLKLCRLILGSTLIASFLPLATPAETLGECAPLNNTARILSEPSPNAAHPDWQGSSIGLSWTLKVNHTATDPFGTEFIGGSLITPRGGQSSETIWGLRSEWQCNFKGQPPQISAIPDSEHSYCAAILQAQDPDTRINLRSGPGTTFSQVGYGQVGDWVHMLRSDPDGDPQLLAQAQDDQGLTWYRVGFPGSGARGWIREDFLTPECFN